MISFPPLERKSDVDLAVKVLTFATLVGLFVHVLWIPMFAVLGVAPVALINVVSLPVYAVALVILRKALFQAWGWLLAGEILVNISVTTVFAGWDGGFHYFAFIVAFGAFAVPGIKIWERWTAFALTAVVYCALYLSTHNRQALSPLPEGNSLQVINIALLFVSIGVLFSSFNASVRRTVRQLNATNSQLERIAGTDPLTGLANRRTMYGELDKAMREFQAAKKHFSLIIADIDGFKGFNDLYGHACGDHVLVQCADFMKASFRSEDTVARWGGEEFLILLPGTELEEARTVTERLRTDIAAQEIAFGEKRLRVTFTFGVCQSHTGLNDIAQLIKQADEAMMTGKREGKNRTIIVAVH